MKLWSIQSPEAYAHLQDRGWLSGDPDFEREWGWTPSQAWGFKPAYDWMVREMTTRLGPAPDGAQYPVWAWARPPRPTRSGAPDMRSGRDEGPCILLELEIPPANILLSDHGLWHMVLNGSVAALSEPECTREEARLAALCERLGSPLGSHGRMEAQHFSRPEVIDLLSKGWHHIFEVAPLREGQPAGMAFSQPADPEWVEVNRICAQACMWRIEAGQVASASHFKPRPPQPKARP